MIRKHIRLQEMSKFQENTDWVKNWNVFSYGVEFQETLEELYYETHEVVTTCM